MPCLLKGSMGAKSYNDTIDDMGLIKKLQNSDFTL